MTEVFDRMTLLSIRGHRDNSRCVVNTIQR
jgi:hypothetical protein